MFRLSRMGATAVAVAALLLVALSPASGRAAETITVTDTLGREVAVPHGAKRVLLGFYFEDFYAIVGPDAYSRVVAISRDAWEGWRNSQWKAYTAIDPRLEKLTDIGEVDAGTFNIEAALVSKPDVAILAAWQYRMLGNAVQKLEKAGIPVVVADYNAQTLEKHLVSTRLIGRVMATEERATALAAQYENAVRDVLDRVGSAKGGAKKVYVELGNSGPDKYGNSYAGHMWGRVIGMAGGTNIADGKITTSSPLNPEYVLASKPEIVLFAGSDWRGRDQAILLGFDHSETLTRERVAPFKARPGWSKLPAVETGDVYVVYHGGARTLYDFAFLQFIAKAIHPEAFADIDPVENHRRFYEEWLPIEANGTFMMRAD
ncbi:ABC transporter substrate-binding protein [Nisaea acidiphila]|uniref:ABC transporter substrate-binding protein n=1 Tax=Nisaea acidiphila TaxID=1862145 RepID=A0A9J7ANQ9_9PROT|nr:ABC transporter substrate-binding protein [Nisaea acidiphila]UUX48570.1 ABC transporter substrate-binding protein [Nisaea acidiphila]